MNISVMARILREEYSMSELEERLSISPDELGDGFEYYVEDNYDKVIEVLREDLHFGD